MQATSDAIEDRLVLDELVGALTPFERIALYLKFAVGYSDRQIGELLFGSDPTIDPVRHRDRGRDLLRSVLDSLRKDAA